MKNSSPVDAKKRECGPTFVVGMNGSGTTMLADSLGMHPQLYMFPYEVRLLPYLVKNKARWGDLSKIENRRRLARALYQAKPFWQANGRQAFSLSDAYLELPGFAASVAGVFRCFAEHAGKQRWGEKSPMNVLHMNLLASEFPNARFVHIVRDARDAAQSFHRRFGFVPAETVSRWKEVVTRARAQGSMLGAARYFELRYEDLTADPEVWMRRVCDFLELPFDPVVLQSSMRMADAKLAMGEARIRPNSGKWAEYFSPAELRYLEGIAGRRMAEMGYEVAIAGDMAPSGMQRIGWRAVGLMRRSWLHFRRWGWKGAVGFIKTAAVSLKQIRSGH